MQMNDVVSHEESIQRVINERYHLVRSLYQIKRKGGKRYGFLNPAFLTCLYGFKLFKTPNHMLLSTIRGHRDCVRCMTIHGDMLYSGSWDGDICVWDISTPIYPKVATLEGKTHYKVNIICLKVHGNLLYSGNAGNNIGVWDITTFEPVTTLRGHTGYVMTIEICGNMLYSGSWDKSVSMWNIAENYSMTTIYAARQGVNYITAHDNMLFIGHQGKGIEVLDIKPTAAAATSTSTVTSRKVTTIGINESHADVWCIHISKSKVDKKHITMYAGCSSGDILIYDISSLFTHTTTSPIITSIGTLRGHSSNVFSLALQGDDNSILYSAGGDGTIRVWDTHSKQHMHKLTGHEDFVMNIQVHKNKLYSGCKDKKICVWLSDK